VIQFIFCWFEKLQRGTDIQNGEILSQESKCTVSDSNHRQIGSSVELEGFRNVRTSKRELQNLD
jgi:hypothetical protein